MTDAAATGPIRSTLIDIANCIGCRACQVACKQWNEKDGEETSMEAELGFQIGPDLGTEAPLLIKGAAWCDAYQEKRHGHDDE